ncbi:uncharacterized protein ZSWIM9-like isoform X2 [Protopterus annectens]|nr:uncharacterized protein ZSWIM9-like isoform X2 [Protopterus annectens]XP_043934363.1 uncharacterized protein ZSWIM9-like isoform X2 [Protopterus annectens]
MSATKRPLSPTVSDNLSDNLSDEMSEPGSRMENELSDMSFSSWEEFCRFFDSWCEKSKVLFNKIKGVPLSKWKGTGSSPSPEQVEVLRYRTVLLVCKHYRARGGYVQSSTGDYRPGCPARILVKLDPVQNKLIVVTAELEHNHELCPIEFAKCFRKNRYVGENDSSILIRVTNETSKQFLNLRDLHRLQHYCRAQDSSILDILKEIEDLLREDQGAKVRLVFVEGQVVVKAFVFITSCMKRLCDRFPRVLYFDKMTYLSEEFDLYFILCEDANGRGRECLYCIGRKDTEDIFRFILVSLVQSVPDIKTRVNCLILGNVNEDLSIIQTVLPNAKVQFCRTQVLESLYNKAIEIEGVFQDNIWDFFCKLANSWSPVSYSRNLREMNSMFSKEFIEYFQDTWDTRKEMWVESWAFERNKGSTFSRFVRSHQQMLSSELGSYHTMAEYIGRLHKLQTLKTETTDLEEEKIQPRFREICSYDLASLIEEEIGLGKNGCYRMKLDGDNFVLDDGTAEYTVNKEQNSCSCTIYTSTLLPCRHIFATRLWTGETICFSIRKQKSV